MIKKRGLILLVLISLIVFSMMIGIVSGACPVGVDNGDGTCTVTLRSVKSGLGGCGLGGGGGGCTRTFMNYIVLQGLDKAYIDYYGQGGEFRGLSDVIVHYEYFDLIGVSGTINSATLYKYKDSYSIGDDVNEKMNPRNIQNAHRTTLGVLTENFYPSSNSIVSQNIYLVDSNGDGIWDTDPITGVCNTDNCKVAKVTSPNEALQYDVANIVQDWVNGILTNYGFSFLGNYPENGISTATYYFNNTATYYPKLIITYELPECFPDGTTQACNTGQLGICAAGTQTCIGGRWGGCTRDNNPTTEICNDGLDNDCDGFIDCLDSDCSAAPNCIQTSFNYAKWTRAGVEISVIADNTNVNMTVKGVNLQNNEKIRFRIYENETNGNIYITEINSTISNNEANAEWLALWMDDGLLQGDPEFYFTAVLVSNSNINITSGLLSIPEGCVAKNCSDISLIEGQEVCGSWDDGCDGSVDCACTIGDCVDETTGPNDGFCEITATVINCSDYNVLNFGSGAEGNCTEYSENIAEYTIEVERNEGSGFCNYQDPTNGCNTNCFCYWDSDNSECKGDWELISCNDPGDEGICMLTGAFVLKECEENPAGTRILNQTFEWTGTGTRPDECLASNVVNLKCLSKIALDFFDNINLIIAILIIILFYIIVWRKRENLKKEKIKRKKR